jgi:uncharacterized protein (DUF2252 family)
MRTCVPLVEGDVRDKHRQMNEDPFQFFRGSYYRWAQLWPEFCPDLLNAPLLLSVGDEAWPLPYTNDLVRLAASVKIARKLGSLRPTSCVWSQRADKPLQ